MTPPNEITIQNASVWFPIRRGILAKTIGHIKAVENVSFQWTTGETIGLAGESGCGKTTLGRAIAGLEKLSHGHIDLNGQRWQDEKKTDSSSSAVRRKIQMIFQDPLASLNPRLSICEILTEGIVYHGLFPKNETREEMARRLLNDVGLASDLLWRYPFEFSGGQRQRICIARALALRPEYLICDEVVSALDVSIQAQIINLLTDLRARYSLGYLMIGHDISVLRHMSHRIAVMYLGHLVEIGPASSIVKNPLHPYTQALLAAVPIPGKKRSRISTLHGEPPSPISPPSGCPFHPRCPHAMPQCREIMPKESIPSSGHILRCHLYPPI